MFLNKRVHAFLEQWGLINYQVDYEARAAPLGPPCTSHFTVLADTPSGLAPITGPRPTSGPSAGKQMIDFKSTATTKPSLLKSSSSTDDKESLTTGSTTTTATNVDKLNIENFGLNTKIEQPNKKQSNTNSQNGIVMSSSIMRNQEWSDQEILLLLEGLEMFKDDWNKVCEHVGTRTQDECILKFLQLPIEDPYLDPAIGGGSGSGSGLGPLAYQPIPFSQSGNPVMSTVAFLASMVDPRVASAAAKAAIAEFSKMKDEVPPATMDSHLSNIVQTVKDGKKLDANYNIEQTGIAIVPEQPTATATAVVKEQNEIKETETKTTTEAAAAMEVDAPSTATPVAAAVSTESTTESDIKIKSSEPEKESETKKSDESTTAVEISNEDQIKQEAEQPSAQTSTTAAVTVTTTTTTTLSTTTTTTATASLTKETTSSPSPSGASSSATSNNMISEVELKNAAASALAAAAVKARQLALNEEKKIKSTVTLLVETQLKKLEIKLRHFEELEAIMDRERENLEHQRQQLLQERQQFHLEQLRAAELRQRQQAAQQLMNESKLNIIHPAVGAVATTPGIVVSVPQPPPPQQQQQQVAVNSIQHNITTKQPAATPSALASSSSSTSSSPSPNLQSNNVQSHNQLTTPQIESSSNI